MVKAVYIHIPFCKNICSYCSFCKLYYNDLLASEYLDSLKREVLEKYKGEVISTIYIGGGTPSDLSINNLKKLFEIINLIKKDNDYEFSFECNFNIDKDKLLFLKNNGVNRLSFGIETVNNKYLSLIDRSSDKKKIIEIISYCREIGFNNINGDLMYAFRDEDISELNEDILFMLSLNLEHISTYSLIIEEHTKLFINNYLNCSDEMDSKMYYHIHDYLIKGGYEHYEISNFSKKGYNSLHNMTYWDNSCYYGFGLGASGYLLDRRYTNTRSLNKYNRGEFTSDFEKLSKYDKMSYEMILGLRTSKGISVNNFYDKYNQNVNEVFKIDDLLEKGYLKLGNDRLYIPYDKWYVMNSIVIRFVR